ncbi:DUF5643 domain-containing protein [Paenibacillus xylanilyticus]|uniref:DUF5643 domain-containing protein n=1 Tax=Paenibacillus xylanilyticus TaxID=248903 RepID=UPI0039A3CD40
MNKIYKVMTTAALTGVLIGGAAWVVTSMTEHAAAKAPAVQNIAAKKVANTAGITQGGITLGVSKAFYDGNYIDISLQRSGKGLVGGMADRKFDEKTMKEIVEKGSIKDIKILINGKSIGGGAMGWGPGSTTDTAIIRLSDPSWLGGQLKAFPNKFKLTAKITLEGVSKPYTFDLSLQKTAGKAVALKPNVTKITGDLTVNLSKLNLTSTSSRIQLIAKGKQSDISYEVVDDQGKELDIFSIQGSDENNKAGDMYYDFVLSPLGKNAKSITIRAYKPKFAVAGATSGAYELDADGNIVKEYVKELEMKVKVK